MMDFISLAVTGVAMFILATAVVAVFILVAVSIAELLDNKESPEKLKVTNKRGK